MELKSIILVISIAILASGCMVDGFGDVNKINSNFKEAESNLTGDEILERSLKNVRKLDSYR